MTLESTVEFGDAAAHMVAEIDAAVAIDKKAG